MSVAAGDGTTGPGRGGSPSDGAASRRDRVVLHVDMDAFFASVEVLDDPALAGRPVIVGGDGRRGVVAACTYEARRFGVHSAMPSSVARRLCPDAVFVHGRYHRYVEESRRLHAILTSFTPLVEGIALDEAFCDVTGAVHLFGDGPAMGEAIRRRVRDELRLECSVGVGRSKLIAKLASKAAKPVATAAGIAPGPGVVAVAPAEETAFLGPLPARALWGIGPVTERRLASLGVTTVGELAAFPPEVLERFLGAAAGRQLSELARGIDLRPVVPVQEAKSIGHEETFATDLWSSDDLHRRLQRMVDASGTALRAAGRTARTVTVKLRFADFRQITRSQTLDGPIDATPAIAAVAAALFDSVERHQGVRLLGVSLSGLAGTGGATQLQLALDHPDDSRAPDGGRGDAPRPGAPGGGGSAPPGASAGSVAVEAARLQDSWGSVTAAVDAIRERYGGGSVGPASLVTPEGIRVRRRGEAQWGPDDPPGPRPGERDAPGVSGAGPGGDASTR